MQKHCTGSTGWKMSDKSIKVFLLIKTYRVISYRSKKQNKTMKNNKKYLLLLIVHNRYR